jgi:hypothetical protein
MPLAVLTRHSTLLTTSGWTETSTPGINAAIGVDRHGQLSTRDVEVSLSSDAAAEHFLGTRAAFGAFHSDTVVVDAGGGRRLVASICEAEEIQSLKWESCVYGGDLMHLRSGMDQLWGAFGAAALARNTDTLVVKSCRDGFVGEERFVRVSRSQLEQDCAASGFAGASKWIVSLLSARVDLASADRRAYRLALWLATCRKATGERYRFVFDSIQHTCTIKVELAADAGQVEPLRTAFSAGITNSSIISWTDRSWSPVSSGFILDGRRP